MTLLLDTCSLLWAADETGRLGSQALQALRDARNNAVAHQVSLWEMQIKYDRGQLDLDRPPLDWMKTAVQRHDLDYHWIEDEAIAALGGLPDLHRDPFDRLLIAHALTFNCTLVTPDPHISRYPSLKVLW